MFCSPSDKTLSALGFVETHGIGLWTHAKMPGLMVDVNPDLALITRHKSEREMLDADIDECMAGYDHAKARKWLLRVGVPAAVLDVLDEGDVARLGWAAADAAREERVSRAEAMVLG